MRPKEDRRDAVVAVKLTQAERRKFERYAERHRTTLSEGGREAILSLMEADEQARRRQSNGASKRKARVSKRTVVA